MMPAGPILLLVVTVMTAFGLLDGPLARLGLSPRSAVLLTATMLVGSLVEVPLAPQLSINLGGGLIPLLTAALMLTTAPERDEPGRALAAALVAVAAVVFLERWFPPGQPTELNLFDLDAQYLYGLMAGVAGGLVSGSRRAAFAAGVIGVLLGGLVHHMGAAEHAGITRLGGGGFHDTPVLAGVIAVMLTELLGVAAVLDAKGEIHHNKSDT